MAPTSTTVTTAVVTGLLAVLVALAPALGSPPSSGSPPPPAPPATALAELHVLVTSSSTPACPAGSAAVKGSGWDSDFNSGAGGACARAVSWPPNHAGPSSVRTRPQLMTHPPHRCCPCCRCSPVRACPAGSYVFLCAGNGSAGPASSKPITQLVGTQSETNNTAKCPQVRTRLFCGSKETACR